MKFSQMLSALAAIMFCVHPLNTSAVAWIPGRNDTLLTLFVLNSFIFFLRAHDTKRGLTFAVHILLFFFALLVKESAIVLPFLCIGYIYIAKGEKLQRVFVISLVTAYGIIVTIWFFMRNMVYHNFEVHNAGSSLRVSWFNNLPAYFLYIGKVFIPINLSVFPNFADHSVLLGILTILLFAGLLFVLQPANFRVIIWGILWFFLFLAPSLLGEPTFYEHRAYCPLVGILIAVASLPAVRYMDFTHTAQLAGVGVLLLIFSLITFFHENIFRDRESFTSNANATAPSADQSFTCIATKYLDDGNYPTAEKVILAEIKRNPRMVIAYGMLGDIYANRHEDEHAAQEYERSIQLAPLDLTAYLHYGKMNIEIGQIDAAVHLWKTMVGISPDFLIGYYYLANCYLHSKNDPDSALVYVRELQRRGETVLPELLKAIESHPLYLKKH